MKENTFLALSGAVATIVLLAAGFADAQTATTTPSLAAPAITPLAQTTGLPVISAVAATSTATSAAATWVTDQVSDSQVTFGTSTKYTATTTGNPLSLDHSVSLNGLTPGTLYHFSVASSNGYGQSVSPDQTFTTASIPASVDTVPPELATSSVITTATMATVMWTTDEPTSAYLLYGLRPQYGSVAADTADLIAEPSTVHDLLLSSLAPGTTYHYKIFVTNTSGSVASSTDETFTTAIQ